MKLYLSVAAMLIISGGSTLAGDLSYPLTHERGIVNVTFYGCKNRNDWKRMRELVAAEDQRAAEKWGATHCTPIAAGTEVISEDFTWLTADICVRPIGAPDCLWIAGALVRKK